MRDMCLTSDWFLEGSIKGECIRSQREAPEKPRNTAASDRRAEEHHGDRREGMSGLEALLWK